MSLRGSFQPKKASSRAATSQQPQQLATSASSRSAPITVRRPTIDDVKQIQQLFNEQSLMQREGILRSYGSQRIATLIESSVLCLLAEQNGSLLAFAAFGDEAPAHFMHMVADYASSSNRLRKKNDEDEESEDVNSEMEASDWARFLHESYALSTTPQLPSLPVTSFNSGWVRYLLVREETEENGGGADGSLGVQRILHTFFSLSTCIDQLFLCPPTSLEMESSGGVMEKCVEVRVSEEASMAAASYPASMRHTLSSTRLLLLPRSLYLPTLITRRARIEDHDDLVPVFNTQSQVLTEVYGEFFLATLIQSQDEHQVALVAEVAGRARGLMGLTDQVDVKLLQRCFELEAYEQLRKAKEEEEEKKGEEEGAHTPFTRLHNIFMTIVSNPAPLSAIERERAAMVSRRNTSLGKRASGAGPLAALAGMLKSEAAPAGGASGASGATSPTSSHLELPVGAAPASSSSSPTLSSSSSSPSSTPLTSFPPHWLLNYVECFKSDGVNLQALAQLSRSGSITHTGNEEQQQPQENKEAEEEAEAKESARGGEEAEVDEKSAIAAEEEQEALQVPIPVFLNKLQAQLSALSNPSSLDARTFNDLIVSTLSEWSEVSLGGLLRFLELAVKVPSDMPIPDLKQEDEGADDGTAAENVFCITLFCLDEEYESRSLDLLRAAFTLYPDRDYCLLTLPHTTSPASTLNLLTHFTLVPPTPRNTFSHVLYLLHRDSMETLNELRVSIPRLTLDAEHQFAIAKAAGSGHDHQAEGEEGNLALDAQIQGVWEQVEPLVQHLPNMEQIRQQLFEGLRYKVEAASLGGGSEGRRIAVAAAKGALQPFQQPTGSILLAQKRALQLQLTSSQTSPTETLMIWCQGSLVGLVLFNRLSPDEVDVLRAEFGVEELVSLEDLPTPAVPKSHQPLPNPHDPTAPLPPPRLNLSTSVHLNVLTFVINPLWNSQVGFVCRELLRMAGASVLYYQVWSGLRVPSVLDNLPPQGGLQASFKFSQGGTAPLVPQLLETFVQVRPRRRPINGGGEAEESKKEQKEGEEKEDGSASTSLSSSGPLPCALHLLSRRLLSHPKTILNSRLVVVGCSSTALSFLEHLLLMPDKHYTSITLLSRDGLRGGEVEGACDPNTAASSPPFLPSSLSHTPLHLARLALGARIKVVRGTLVSLDVTAKTLSLADGATLPYDILVLVPGLQNQLPLQLMRQVRAQALADELRAKQLERARREAALREDRRRRKAAEQGFEDLAEVDPDTLARIDEELDREDRRAAASKLHGGQGEEGWEGGMGAGAGVGASEDDEDDESLSPSKGGTKVALRRKGSNKSSNSNKKKGRSSTSPNGSPIASSTRSITSFGRTHTDWKRWVSWSSSGLEHWESEYGILLSKQRALEEGTLDPLGAIESNQRMREAAMAQEEQGGSLEDFDPSQLDLMPYGLSGVYSLSSQEHRAQLLRAFEAEEDRQELIEGGWLVNGASLEALTAIRGLMSMGVAAENITWVHPNTKKTAAGAEEGGDAAAPTVSPLAFLNRSPSSSSTSPSSADAEDDPLILGRIMTTLQSLGVVLMPGKAIKHVRQQQGRIYAVVLHDAGASSSSSPSPLPPPTEDDDPDSFDESELELSVVGVIGVGELDVDPYIYRALQSNSLVYDGRLVLNHQFQTNVDSIYAAGPIAKFSRKFGRKVGALEEYNSGEVGRRLGEAVLKTALDVEVAAAEKAKAATAVPSSLPPASLLPPLGWSPRVQHAHLPGGLLYFHASTPSPLVSGTPKPTRLVTSTFKRIVRMEFDQYQVLQSFTLLADTNKEQRGEGGEEEQQTQTADRPSSPSSSSSSESVRLTSLCHNLVHLLGLPASFMNRLLFRYQQGQLPDLLDFLSAPWASALYHESFGQLRSYLHWLLLEQRVEMVAILDRIMQMFASQAAEAAEAEQGGAAETEETEGSDPFLVSQLVSLLPPHIKQGVQRALLRFLRQHANHLPGYVVPKQWYAGPQAKPKPVA